MIVVCVCVCLSACVCVYVRAYICLCVSAFGKFTTQALSAEIFTLALTANPYVSKEGGYPSLS